MSMAGSIPAYMATEPHMPDQPLADSPEPLFAHPADERHNVSMHPLQNLSRRVGRLENRAEQVDHRLERVEGRLEHVEGRLERVDGRLERMEGRLERVEGQLERVDGQLERVDGRIERLEGETHVIKADLAVIKSNYATKADVANAKFSIILWVVSAVFLAQLLPAVPAFVRALDAVR